MGTNSSRWSGKVVYLGISPYQYPIEQRVELAKRLLKQKERSIMEIAELCEFNSHSHSQWSKQFRQFTGMTPRARAIELNNQAFVKYAV